MMRLLRACLPHSLVGRVFGLYTIALVAFVGIALGVFIHHQLNTELERALLRAEAMVEVISPTVTESAVIGDYDSIQKTLQRAIYHSDYAHAVFIDMAGGTVHAARTDPPETDPPDWLVRRVARTLYDSNHTIVAGGRDYGVLRLSYADRRIAGGLWGQTRAAMGMALAGLLGGLLLIGLPLRHWLGNLGQIQSLQENMRFGMLSAPSPLSDDAPIEFKRTFDVLSRVAADMHKQREQADVTLQAIADGVLTLDSHGRVVLSNPAAARALGRGSEALLGRRVEELLPALFAATDLRHGYPAWNNRRVLVQRPGGDSRVLDTTLSPIADGSGVCWGHVLACKDVSEQHALDIQLQGEQRAREAALASLRTVLEGLLPQTPAGRSGDMEAVSFMISRLVQSMREHSHQLKAIFALSPDGFVSFDLNRTVAYVSPAFTLLTGLDDTEVLGMTEVEFARQVAVQCDASGSTLSNLLDFASPPGMEPKTRHLLNIERPTRRTLEVSVRRDEDRTISQIVHLRDVTHETEVDQMKSEFLSAAAHELRTPMSSIYGFIELMLTREMTPERQKDVLATVHRQTALMIAIINELLDLARIETRRGKDFVIETIDLRGVIRQVVEGFRPPEDRSAPELDISLAPVFVRADRSKLTQALSNLVSNAYKYSPGGGAVVIKTCEQHQGRLMRLGVAVRDVGIGMSPEQLERVGERFYRVDTTGTIPGTGLGLCLVKEIAQLLGGELVVASQIGKGTTATLWLPVPQSTQTEPMPLLDDFEGFPPRNADQRRAERLPLAG